MKIMERKKLPICIFMGILLWIVGGCRRAAYQPPVHRLLDPDARISVITTPLMDFTKRFETQTHILKAGWTDLTRLFGSDRFRVWGIETPFPVLAFDETQPPPYMFVSRDGEPFPYLGDPGSQNEGWRCIRGEAQYKLNRRLDPKLFDSEGAFFSTEVILPSGPFRIRLDYQHGFKDSTAIRINVLLDDDLLGTIRLGDAKQNIITGTASSGKHLVRLQSLETAPASLASENNINWTLFIKSDQDLLLLYLPTGMPSPIPGSFSIDYIREPFSPWTPPNKSANAPYRRKLYDLHRFNLEQHTGLRGSGMGPNPYKLKKKLQVADKALNVYFAPTPTTLSWELTVPENSRLHFGWGLLESTLRENHSVAYEIELEHDGQAHRIFSKKLTSASPKQPHVKLHQKIDLADFADKKIRLLFKTSGWIHNRSRPRALHSAFWINPVISPVKQDDDPAPNVILISLDTLRADHLGSYGYSRNTSPHIDAFQKESVFFSRAFSTAPATLCAHMSLMTGLNSHHHQIRTGRRLHPEIPTLAEFMSTRGYATAAFTGGGQVSGIFGFNRGFDLYQENTGRLLERDTPDKLLNQSLNWISHNRGNRFFLFLHTYQIHAPYWNESPLGGLFLNEDHIWDRLKLSGYLKQRAGSHPHKFIPLSKEKQENIIALYDGEIRYTDEVFFGPLLDGLHRLGLYDNTMIILTADHGEAFYEHGMWLHEIQLYNELTHIPLMIKYPRSRHAGMRIVDNVRITDIMPTILGELRHNPSGWEKDGRDLAPLIRGRRDPARICFADVLGDHEPARVSVIRENKKMIFNQGVHRKEIGAPDPPAERELYDFVSDPQEKQNLADIDPQASRELMKLVREYLQVDETARIHRGASLDLDQDLINRLRALGYIQ